MEQDPSAGLQTLIRAVTPGYLDGMGMRVLAGRAFTDADRPGSEQVAVVNATFAREMFPAGTAVGEVVVVRGVERRIVGVASDVVEFTIQDGGRDRVLYTPYQQEDQAWMRVALDFVIRAHGSPAAAEAAARGAIARASGSIVPGAARTMRSYLERDIEMHRFRALLALAFAGVALLLAGVGVAAVTAQSVSRRVPEIGVRVALGSTPAAAVRTIMRPLARVTLVGLAIGLVAAMLAGRLLEAFLFGVHARDPLVLLVVALLILGAAAAGSWIPARRAAVVDPVLALRSE